MSNLISSYSKLLPFPHQVANCMYTYIVVVGGGGGGKNTKEMTY